MQDDTQISFDVVLARLVNELSNGSSSQTAVIQRYANAIKSIAASRSSASSSNEAMNAREVLSSLALETDLDEQISRIVGSETADDAKSTFGVNEFVARLLTVVGNTNETIITLMH